MAVSIAGASRRAAMSRSNSTTEKADPWRVPVVVAQIPDTGLHRDIEPNPLERQAMAEVAGLREISSVNASFDVTDLRGHARSNRE